VYKFSVWLPRPLRGHDTGVRGAEEIGEEAVESSRSLYAYSSKLSFGRGDT
jgi:hypothetical protein